MSGSYVIAWLLSVSAGTAVYLAVSPQRVAGLRASAVGYGFLFGMFLAAIFTSFASAFDTTRADFRTGLCLFITLIVAAIIAWRRRQASASTAAAGGTALVRWQKILLAGLIVSLVARGALAAREIWLRPLYPWDAWSAWATKPKAWFLLGHYVPFASTVDWLHSAQGNLYTDVAWHYPHALAWIEVWLASAAGDWIEPLVNLPWIGLWAALLFAHYGQWRALGLSRVRALVFVYALGSLPLLSVHAALAGYADLWIATVFGLGVLSWMRWLRYRETNQLCLALICALALPTLKMEGWVWMACLLVAIGFGMLPARYRRWIAVGGLLLLIVLFPLGGLRFLSLHTGVMNADGSIAMPAIGPLALLLDLHWQPGALAGTLESLFAQPNWHLLWWLTPAILVWRWRELTAHDWLRLPALLLSVCATLLLILFFFTGASAWAQSYTAVNRLILQLVPAWMTVLALLLQGVYWPRIASDTAPARGLRSDPA